MKRNKIFIMAAVALVALLVAPNFASAYTISYKGQSGKNNNPIDIAVWIYGSSSGVDQLWPPLAVPQGDIHNRVPKVAGNYVVEIGPAYQAEFDALFTGQKLWL